MDRPLTLHTFAAARVHHTDTEVTEPLAAFLRSGCRRRREFDRLGSAALLE